MPADDNKTVFIPGSQPFQSDPNATVVIPNPGGRLRPESGAPPASSEHPTEAVPRGQPPLHIRAEVRGQANVILSASTTLITVLSALSNSMSHPNVAQLQQELATEIGIFDTKLKQARVRNEEALTARYILCSAIDEIVMNTPWGAESGWSQRSLLRVYHNEASGGERFFVLLDQLMARPQEYRNLLELFYVLLHMGFKGKYHLDPAGDARIDTLRERLHQDLYGGQSNERALSDTTSVMSTVKPKLRNQVPLWVVLSVSLALTLIVYTGLRAWMYTGTVDIADNFDQITPTQITN